MRYLRSVTRIELRAEYFQCWLAEERFYVNVGAGCHENGITSRLLNVEKRLCHQPKTVRQTNVQK